MLYYNNIFLSAVSLFYCLSDFTYFVVSMGVRLLSEEMSFLRRTKWELHEFLLKKKSYFVFVNTVQPVY